VGVRRAVHVGVPEHQSAVPGAAARDPGPEGERAGGFTTSAEQPVAGRRDCGAVDDRREPGLLLRRAETADPDDPFTHGLRHRYNDLETERRTLDAELARIKAAAAAPTPDRHGDLLSYLPLATMDLSTLPQPVLRTLCEAFRIRITYDHETRRAHYYAEIEAGSLDGLSKLITHRAQICDVPLIQRLMNGQFVLNTTNLAHSLPQPEVAVGPHSRCACGCGQPVAGSRKFIDQSHYSEWLSHERHFGKNRRH
jgi:hypothetical protein